MTKQMTVGEAVMAWMAGNITLAELGGSPHEAWEAFWGYVMGVDWQNERWLWMIGGLHAVLLCLVVATRRRPRVQLALLGAFSVMAFCSGVLNDWARTHWAEFSTQPYFDRSGAFASLVWSGPLAVLGVVVVVNLLVHTARLMVVTKRRQARARRSRQQEKKDN